MSLFPDNQFSGEYRQPSNGAGAERTNEQQSPFSEIIPIPLTQTEIVIEAHRRWAEPCPENRTAFRACEKDRMSYMVRVFREFVQEQGLIFESESDYAKYRLPTFIHSQMLVGGEGAAVCSFLAEVRNNWGESVVLAGDRPFIFEEGIVLTRVFEKAGSSEVFSCEALFSPKAFQAQWREASRLIYDGTPVGALIKESFFMREVIRHLFYDGPMKNSSSRDIYSISFADNDAPLPLSARTSKGDILFGPIHDLSCRISARFFTPC